MKRPLALVILLALAVVSVAQAQDGPSTNVPTPDPATAAPSATTGPVVTPPPQEAPPVPSPAPAASAAMTSGPATDAISPALPGSSLASPTSSAGAADDIDDIRPPFFYLHSWFWLWMTLLALALIALAIGLWLWFRPLRALRAKSAYDLALEKLERARALLDPQNPEPYAVAVSEAIRHYLGQRFATPSSRRTTEEFLRQMETDTASPLAEHRDLLRGFLEACDLVKFAHYQPGLEELEEVQQRAVTFVTATKPVEQDGAKAAGARPSAPVLTPANGGRP
jgi:hypothetical protein